MSDATEFEGADNCDIVLDSFTSNDESDELFSDDEQKREINCNIIQDTSVLHRSETPLLSTDNSNSVTPSNAVIPSTPLSLVPFLNKINEQWTSDLETPQADKSAQLYMKLSTSATKSTEKTPKLEQRTPDILSVKSADKVTSDSPVIVSRTEQKRLKRRRIFKTSVSLDTSTAGVTSNEHTALNVQVEVPLVPMNSLVASNDRNTGIAIPYLVNAHVDRENDGSRVLEEMQDIYDNRNVKQLKHPMSDTLESLSQDFFSNASFSNVDKLCYNNLDKKNVIDSIIQGKRIVGAINEEESAPQVLDLREVRRNKVVGFFTARGTIVNVSKEALFKARTLLADEVQIQTYKTSEKKSSVEQNNFSSSSNADNAFNVAEEALFEPKLTEQLKDYNKTIKNSKKKLGNESPTKEFNVPPLLFSTASGAPIKISKEALSKAKILLTDEPYGDDHANSMPVKLHQTSSAEKGLIKKENMIVSYSTAGDKSISISEKSLTKVKLLCARQPDVPDEKAVSNKIDIADNDQFCVKTSNIGFQTARGVSIQISSQALSKAKLCFAKDLKKPLESNIVEETDAPDAKVERKVAKSPNIGFQTARGTSIQISSQALAKAKLYFAKDLEKPLESNIVEETDTSGTKVEREETKSPNIGFQTAHGASIQISAQAISRARNLFAEQLNCPVKTDMTESSIEADNEKMKRRDSKIPCDGLKIANGRRVTTSNDATSKAWALFSNECPDRSNYDTGLSSRVMSLQKRKLNSDEGTPLNMTSAFGSKKARLSDECEGRQLFADSPSADVDDDKDVQSNALRVLNRMSTNDECNEKRLESTTESSSEIAVDSIERPDEKMQVESVVDCILSHSPTRNTSELTESNAAGSPVIGRSRRRKRRSKHASPPDATERQTSGTVDASSDKIHEGEEPQRLEQTLERPKAGSSESTEYGDTQMMMDFIDESASILRDRLAAALEQEKMITAKRRYGSEQRAGHLFRRKQTSAETRLTLRDASNGAPPVPRSYQELIDQRIPPNILAITAASAASYKFRCSDFYGSEVARSNVHGIEMEDDGRLIMDENGYAGVWEFLRAFLASPGVDPNLVPARWIENHYRWIVWKLASMDRMKFGSAELARYRAASALTPSHVMAQLKYRYDREIDRSQRSAIRRILEKDDVPSRRMILCVSSIAENNSNVVNAATDVGGRSPRVSKWRIELTDGWYSVAACIDTDMARHVSNGKVKEGTKLLVFGAELLNCEEGCYPLEASADVCLKLHTNSTRRARWDARLGYTSCSAPITVRLRDVCPNGGLIGKMTVVIARIYPMLYHERTSSGDSIVRNAKCEERAQIEYERRCGSEAEAFYDKAEKDFEEDDFSCEPETLAGEKRRDELLRQLHAKKERFQRELQSKLPAPRQVCPLLRVRVCDGDANAILSIWSPSEEVVDDLREGACVSLCNIVASGKRGCELQLTARRSAIFLSRTTRDASYPARTYTSFREVDNSEFSLPYGEFDTVGFVCSVGPAPYGLKDFEVAHLAYPEADTDRSSYLSVLFWQGIASYGYAEMLTVGSMVACKNLEWRRATSWNIPVAYCTDRTTFTRNPRRNHLYESFGSLRSSIADSIAYADKCVFELNVELQKKPTTRTPTRYVTHSSAQSCTDKKSVDYTSPKLGAAGSFIATSSSIQKRLDKLQWYEDPPELSPIVMRSSKRISLDFRSPVCTLKIPNSTKDTETSEFLRDPRVALEKQ